MNSYERVLSVLNREEPDRVPTFEWLIDQVVITGMCGKNCSLEQFVDEMDIDGIVATADNKKEVIGENHFIDEWGIEKKSVYTDPLPMAIRSPISNKNDLRRLRIPNPHAPFRMNSLREIVKRYKGKKAIVFQVRDGFSTARDLLGFDKVLMGMLDDPIFIRELVEISTEYYLKLATWAIEEGADIIFSGDDLADNRGPLFNPRLYKEIFLPGFKRLVDGIKTAGAYYIKHTDGNVWELIPYFIEAGVDCLDPIEKPANMDMRKVKKEYGTYLVLKGNIDCRYTLTQGTAEDVRAEVRQCIAEASFGGGHIISSSNSIHSGVNPDNYAVMLESIREYGTYPINENFLKD